MNINIDKGTWRKVRLGDVAFEYSKRINNPSESEYDRFVGSSNIGQWDFRVKSWESTASVTSPMKLFEADDYLMVRRSLYASDFRERAPRAHFNGVCSGDILTIKENPEFIADGFLIGVLNSSELWKFVVANGSGSITRRIHWKDLATYEFLLPPKDQQKLIAELLWAGDENQKKHLEVLDQLRTYRDSYIKNNYTEVGAKPISLAQLVEVNPRMEANLPKENLEVSFIPMQGVSEEGKQVSNESREISEVRKGFTFFRENDILFAKITPCMENGKGAIASGLKNSVGFGSTEFHVLRPKRSEDLLFCFYLTMMPDFRFKAEQQMTGSAGQKRVPTDFFNFFKFAAPDEDSRQTIGKVMHEISRRIEEVNAQICNIKVLQKSLISQFC